MNSRTKRSGGILAVGLTICSMVLVACGSSDGTDPSATPTDDLWSGPALTTQEMSPEDAAALDKVNETALKAVKDVGNPGMWIGVWDPDKGMHLAAYGDAEVGAAEATIEDHSRIGSVTKTFTATAILQLVAAGQLSLDDTVADLLPDLAETNPEIAEITLQELLSMQSGIPDYVNTGLILEEAYKNPDKVWTRDEIIERVLTETKVDPSVQDYSTTNYLILGEILEETTSTPPHETLTSLAESLAMDNTALPAPDDNEMPEPASTGYIREPGIAAFAESGVTVTEEGPVQDSVSSWGGTGGGMYSIVADLGIWAGSGLGTSTLPEDLGQQRIDETTDLASDTTYGMGLQVWGEDWIGHTGQAIGWETIVAYNTKTGAAYVGMVNETGSVLTLFASIQEAFPDLSKAMLGL